MKRKDELKKGLEGVLHLFSETGTEGGSWAFQDKRYITLDPPTFGVFERQTVYDINKPTREGKTQDNNELLLDGRWVPLHDPMTADPDYFISSLFCGEHDGNHEADKRLMEKYGFKIKYNAERMDEEYGKGNWHFIKGQKHSVRAPDGTNIFIGSTPDTEPDRPYGVPKNGLTRATVKWEDGEIEKKRLSNTLLVKNWSYDGLHILENGDQLTIYHPDNNRKVWSGTINLKRYAPFTEHASGMWIHADQIGIERDIWSKYLRVIMPN